MRNQLGKTINILQEFSIPLIFGVGIALIWSNLYPEGYHHFVHNEFLENISAHLLMNDVFLAFFFAMATAEITQSLMPGGELHPLKRSVNPIMGTLGGVIGPVIVFFILNYLFGSDDLLNGWGIPTATDIALAWLVARLVFGAYHPAVSFLLLLAIADDGISLLIIAFFYPDPLNPLKPGWLLLTVLGMIIAFILRKVKVKNYWPYIIIGGTLSWTGLYMTGVHPSLAFVFIIPFLPHANNGKLPVFEDYQSDRSTLKQFEHEWKIFVDFGLLLFGLTNAGVEFNSTSVITWIIFAALLIGKTTGIYAMSSLAVILGFPLPEGMNKKDLFVAGIVSSIGLTVALFVASVAYTEPALQGAAKMGALFSIFSAAIAVAIGKLFKIRRITTD